MKSRFNQTALAIAIIALVGLAVVSMVPKDGLTVNHDPGPDGETTDLGYRSDPYGGGWYLQSRHALTDVAKVVVTGYSGKVEITSCAEGRAELTVTRVANSHEAEQARAYCDQVHTDFTRDGNTLRVESQLTDNRVPVAVNYRISMPAGTAIEVDVDAGMIEARSAAADLDLRLDAGMIEIERARGDVRAALGSGSLEVEPASGTRGEYVLQIDSGMITVDFPRLASASLDVQTASGYIDVKTDLDVTEKDRGHLIATYNGCGEKLSVRTQSAAVVIRD